MTLISKERNQELTHDHEDFMEMLGIQIERYEKRFRTTVESIALSGTLGFWDGRTVAGKLLSPKDNPLTRMGEVEVKVELLDNGTIQILGHHHDGTHRMKLYLLTKRMLRNLGHETKSGLHSDIYQQINKHHLPLKLSIASRKDYLLSIGD